MTPCEKLGYKVGDRFEVVKEGGSRAKVGDILVLHFDDGSEFPTFRKPGYEKGLAYCPRLSQVRPLKTEAEKRGAKFGTMGVVKATGKRCVYIADSLVISGYWEIDAEGTADRWHRKPSEIRLDHEPEYKEIPFSEATDEQRMDVGNLVFKEYEFEVSEIKKFSNGQYAYTVKDSDVVFSLTNNLAVRVPA